MKPPAKLEIEEKLATKKPITPTNKPGPKYSYHRKIYLVFNRVLHKAFLKYPTDITPGFFMCLLYIFLLGYKSIC